MRSRTLCAWCGASIGPSKTPEDSHGICRRCKRKMLREIPLWRQVKARAALDGWSAVFGPALVYLALGLWALECIRSGL